MTHHAAGTVEHRPVDLPENSGAGVGLFFIWIGIVILASLCWGVGPLGVGILIFAGQVITQTDRPRV